MTTIAEDNPVRVVDVFVNELDLGLLGFVGVNPAATGRPAYHPAVLLKLYIYGYLNRIQSSRCLEREAQRNVELMWLIGRLAPDFKTIADFRRDNGKAVRKVCYQFVLLCRKWDLFSQSIIAIDGSKFKAVNNRDKNFTSTSCKRERSSWQKALSVTWPNLIAPIGSRGRCRPGRSTGSVISRAARLPSLPHSLKRSGKDYASSGGLKGRTSSSTIDLRR